jgi:hypothetical protein
MSSLSRDFCWGGLFEFCNTIEGEAESLSSI